MHTNGLLIFSNNLRFHDNPSLNKACALSKRLTCVYIVDPRVHRYFSKIKPSISAQRWNFLKQSLDSLARSLEQNEQKLHVLFGDTQELVSRLITELNIDAIFSSQHAGTYECADMEQLKKLYSLIAFYESTTHTLFSSTDLPFKLNELPKVFTPFRKLVEHTAPRKSATPPENLPRKTTNSLSFGTQMPNYILESHNLSTAESAFNGGEHEAILHVDTYFSTKHALSYKATRNALDGWSSSTKLSAWLANGSLSPLRVLESLRSFEYENGKNDSTYWIYFELLWREYFQWYALLHGSALYRKRGIKDKQIHTSFYPHRFKMWCEGNTPYAIVNACMKQLNATGYMSNRGRQIVASCLVNELQLDWRYGAAYFEEKLIDYDVASNWGNWQYLAGVGADPRGMRHFDLNKQAEQFDKDEAFRKAWDANPSKLTLDTVDAADWPISDKDENPHH